MSQHRDHDVDVDVVIVGAGSAGCVLANRLSADPSVRVLLLEAGPVDRNPWIRVPAGVSRLFADKSVNWAYTSEPEPALNDRRLYWPRGKVLGGTSSINGHVYMRGNPGDYDAWAAAGNAGWAWDDVLPLFKRSERHHRGASAFHGGDGELSVSPVREPHPTSQDFVQSAVACGHPRNDDFNGREQAGVGTLEYTIAAGERASAARAFLRPVAERANLRIVTDCLVEAVTFDGRRATGVRYRHAGDTRHCRAGEVLICAGAINSPQLLILSGIGPADDLRRLGIKVVADLPGVGAQLQDHLYLHCLARTDEASSLNRVISGWRIVPEVARYLWSRQGLLTSAAAQVGLFARSSDGLAWPDLQIQMRPFSMIIRGGSYTAEPSPAITASCTLLRPHSRGRVWLASADPAAPPRMRANFLGDERDVQPLVRGMKMLRQILDTPPFRTRYRGEAMPGAGVVGDEALVAYLRSAAQSMYHPVGTCRMGRGPDAVVDPELRVHGIENLRVVDASVMPGIPSGNTNAPTIMIAEKASDLLLRRPAVSTRQEEELA